MGNCMDNLGYDAAAAAAPPLSRQESRAAEQQVDQAIVVCKLCCTLDVMWLQMRRYDNNDDGVLQQ